MCHIIICVYCGELFSQVRDVTHGPIALVSHPNSIVNKDITRLICPLHFSSYCLLMLIDDKYNYMYEVMMSVILALLFYPLEIFFYMIYTCLTASKELQI